jgi:radical SAM-linked protein
LTEFILFFDDLSALRQRGWESEPMVRERVRIRFTKQDDLRWLSHHDLVRAWERLLRRAAVPMGMTEGFHPKPRMNFPSALAVGISGLDELVEIELSEPWSAEKLREALLPHLPPGLSVGTIEVMPFERGKVQAVEVEFQATLPAGREAVAAERIQWLEAQSLYKIKREGRAAPLDLRPLIAHLAIHEGVLSMRLRLDRQGSARPREVLAALGLEDLELEGGMLTRSRVEVSP